MNPTSATFITPTPRPFRLAPGPSTLHRAPRIVALGGGTGLPTLLRGLKQTMFHRLANCASMRERLTAVVTMADDGGSSGRLREAYGVLPPGDLRNCLLALSDGNPRLASLFAYRFGGGGELGGHNLGNLILTALSQMEQDLLRAIEWAGEALDVRGRVLPASLEPITLGAAYEDGGLIEGESRIASAGRRIEHVFLRPSRVRALPEAARAILDADMIVIAPGSLYTSILPILLIREIAEAIALSTAPVALVLNLMAEPGETDGFTASDFVLAIRKHAPQVRVSDVLVNSVPIPSRQIARYAQQGAGAVRIDAEALRFLGCSLVERDLLEPGSKVRHDPLKLARTVMELVEEETQWAITT